MKTVAQLKIRRMQYEDIQQVVEIEQASFPHPWDQQDFDELLTGKTRGRVLSVAATPDGKIMAYAVWERKSLQNPMRLLNLAVHPNHRRQGLGACLIGRPGLNGYPLVADVIETNVPAQLFLRRLGWRCTEIIHQPYDESDRDALRFEAQYVTAD
jgi:ribosomal-protein-alanine N-acetyltransferase